MIVQKGEITLIVGEIEDIDCMRESKVENNLSEKEGTFMNILLDA